jgi:hypothetical protein
VSELFSKFNEVSWRWVGHWVQMIELATAHGPCLGDTTSFVARLLHLPS